MTTPTGGDGLLPAVAAFGLAGTTHGLPAAPLEDASWRRLLADATTARLLGLLLRAVVLDGLPSTDEQRAEVVEGHIRAMSGALLLEDLMLRTTAVLDDAGIPSRVLKGAATAHLDYSSPEQRCYGDVDVLVRSADFDHAVAELAEVGLRRVFQPPRPDFDRRYGKGAMLRGGDGLELDLHRTFCTAPLGLRIDLDDVWAGAETLWLGDRVVQALPRELRLLNAAYNAAAGDTAPKLSTLRDVAQLALHPDLDQRRVRDLATRWRGQAVLAYAVATAWRVLLVGDVTALSGWAERYRATPDEQRELALYQERRASETARALATARMLPTVRSRASYLWALARPDAGFTQATTRAPLQRLVHGLADLRRARERA